MILVGETYLHGKRASVPAMLRALRQMYGEWWPAVWDPNPIVDLRFAYKRGPGEVELRAAWQQMMADEGQRLAAG